MSSWHQIYAIRKRDSNFYPLFILLLLIVTGGYIPVKRAVLIQPSYNDVLAFAK